MANFPSEIICHILSRLPVKSLARFRCVSKLWHGYINDQYLQILHTDRSPEESLIMIAQQTHQDHPSVSFYAIDSYKDTDRVQMAKPIPSLDFKCRNYSQDKTPNILGSCNGLVYLTRDWMVQPSYLTVVNPLRKEYYQLPPMNHRFDQMHFAVHGLGFDDSTNTFKMVLFDIMPKNFCPMLHVFGTNSWRQISRVPGNPTITNEGDWNRAVYARGCLNWLAGRSGRFDDDSKIIRLDMKREEFELISIPKIEGAVGMYCRLVDLHGEVGCVFHMDHGLEVWVLKQKEWVMHCWFDYKPPLPAFGVIRVVRVLGCWNKDGDIFMETTAPDVGKQWFIYCRKSGLLKEVKLVRKPKNYCLITDTFMYPSSLFSIHGIKAYSIKN